MRTPTTPPAPPAQGRRPSRSLRPALWAWTAALAALSRERACTLCSVAGGDLAQRGVSAQLALLGRARIVPRDPRGLGSAGRRCRCARVGGHLPRRSALRSGTRPGRAGGARLALVGPVA